MAFKVGDFAVVIDGSDKPSYGLDWIAAEPPCYGMNTLIGVLVRIKYVQGDTVMLDPDGNVAGFWMQTNWLKKVQCRSKKRELELIEKLGEVYEEEQK